MIIYIPLVSEGTNCWRPTQAEQVGSHTYRIVEARRPEEEWPAATGDVVRCESRRFADGFDGLVVIIPEADLPPPIS